MVLESGQKPPVLSWPVRMKFFSFGGGRQSMAVLVLASQRVAACQFDEFIFSDVGSDSENPGTLTYFENYAQPFAAEFGLKLTRVQRERRGQPLTLREYLMEENRSIAIPARLATGAPGNRECTVNFKIRVIVRYIKRKYKLREWTVGLGISTNEIQRARTGPSIVGNVTQELVYPLLDLRLSLNDCIRIIRDAGLPVPPKSACYFCPFHRPIYWIELREDRPDLFADAARIEARLNEKRAGFGENHNDPVYLHPALRPLEQAVGQQANFFESDNCESGYCMV